ncbi:MAG: hypothetical protein V4671_31570, partial [Armatimonadota bacterium]
MDSIRTATWRETALRSPVLYADGRVGISEKPVTSTYWARVNNPRLTAVRSEHLRSISSATETFQVSRGRDGILSNSHFPWGISRYSSFGGDNASKFKDRVRNAIIFSKDVLGSSSKPNASPRDGRRRIHQTEWISSPQILNGQKTVHFSSTLTYHRQINSPDTRGHFWAQTGETWNFWVEPQTYRIVR